MSKTTRQVRFAVSRVPTEGEAGNNRIRTIEIDLNHIKQKSAALLPATDIPTNNNESTRTIPSNNCNNHTIQHGTTRYVNGVLQQSANNVVADAKTKKTPMPLPMHHHHHDVPPLPRKKPAAPPGQLRSCLKKPDAQQAYDLLLPSESSAPPPLPAKPICKPRDKSKQRIKSHSVFLLSAPKQQPSATHQSPATTPTPPRKPERRRATYQNSIPISFPHRLPVPLASEIGDDQSPQPTHPQPTHRTIFTSASSASSASSSNFHRSFGGELFHKFTASWRRNGEVNARTIIAATATTVPRRRLSSPSIIAVSTMADAAAAAAASVATNNSSNSRNSRNNAQRVDDDDDDDDDAGDLAQSTLGPSSSSSAHNTEAAVHVGALTRAVDNNGKTARRSHSLLRWPSSIRRPHLKKPMPPVTTLLRAARDADEDLLRAVLREILLNGIASEDLNAGDVSGRTALSYICSTNLTHILDIFLQIPGLDVNRADKEGNTPLHFAAQSGQSETVNMLLTRSRSISIDAKNHLGFTPLMKAALQGRTRCAKLLLFAGASPVCVDNGRGFRAEQWARFCSRYTCAEMIETCARARLLDKGTSSVWAHDPHTLEKPTATATQSRTRTAPLASVESSGGGGGGSATTAVASERNHLHAVSQRPLSTAGTPIASQSSGTGIRSKLRKVFSFSFKDRLSLVSSKKDRVQDKTEFSNYFTSTKLCASGAALPTHDDPKTSQVQHRSAMEVPKLEVTPAHNHSLIKKFEKLYGSPAPDTTDSSPLPSPKLPPRCKVRSRN